jgi:translation elongation factor EF-Tu-like GTPase
METRNPDLIARVIYLTIDQGGRRTPAGSGHRPQTKFEGLMGITPAEQIFTDEREYILPGDSAEAEITLVSKDAFRRSLYAGQMFEFFDNDKLIGTGTILRVLNSELSR